MSEEISVVLNWVKLGLNVASKVVSAICDIAGAINSTNEQNARIREMGSAQHELLQSTYCTDRK